MQMLAGSNTRGVYNASNEADQAVSYVCLGQSISLHIPLIV